VRKNFEALLETAKTEVSKCNAQQSQDPPELQVNETSDTSVSSIEPDTSYRKHTPQASLPVPEPELPSKTTLPNGPIISTALPPKIVDIEVDENDDEEDGFVLPPIRLTSRLHRRD
jgi:hypothetical protein